MRRLIFIFIIGVSIALGYFGETKPVQNVVEKTSNVVSFKLTTEQKEKANNAIKATEETVISVAEKTADSVREVVNSLPEKE